MSKVIRIGTRDSELALWQANTVKTQLESLGYDTQIISVKSTGDLVLDKPLYQMGITGIFTKTLDLAMLKNKVDIAVHSMKDVPTLLPKGIVQSAVLKRASSKDILVTNGTANLDKPSVIATGSLRRTAQWLHKYPSHEVVGLRGNVNTRLQKLADSTWQGAIFAKAGLERISLLPNDYIELNWMIPAPAQGAMVVVTREDDAFCGDAVSKLNVTNSAICTHIEREFLNILEGGCTAPIGAIAKVNGDEIHFTGALFSLDGKKKIMVEQQTNVTNYDLFGKKCAERIINGGGKQLMEEIKRKTK